jgi:hypothetical protein
MGCVAATARRRRKQAVGGYKNLAPMRRPHYSTHSNEVWDRRAAAAAERRVAMYTRKLRRKAKG